MNADDVRDSRVAEVLPIQHAVANASPSAWRDAIVTAIGPQHIELSSLDGQSVFLWSSAPVLAGEPVAYHPVAELLAAGSIRYRARRAA
jgi:hypothetical protein